MNESKNIKITAENTKISRKKTARKLQNQDRYY